MNRAWRQQVEPGYKVMLESLRLAPASISCRVTGPGQRCDLTIKLKDGATAGFDLTAAIPGLTNPPFTLSRCGFTTTLPLPAAMPFSPGSIATTSSPFTRRCQLAPCLSPDHPSTIEEN
ncbi:MAG: hypothetical protein ABI540_04780 [Spartobacteria bacterium]